MMHLGAVTEVTKRKQVLIWIQHPGCVLLNNVPYSGFSLREDNVATYLAEMLLEKNSSNICQHDQLPMKTVLVKFEIKM